MKRKFHVRIWRRVGAGDSPFDSIGDKVTLTVSRREQCEERARRYGRETDGGEWVVDNIEVLGRPGTPGRIDPLGNIEEETIQYRCTIRKVR